MRISEELHFAHLMGERPTVVILGITAWRQLPGFILDQIYGLKIQVDWRVAPDFVEVH